FPRMTKIMKWLSITMLLLAVLQLPVASHPVLLATVVCVSGLLIAAQAVRAGKYSWAVGFLAIAVLFNPVVPIARSGRDILCINGIQLTDFVFFRPVTRQLVHGVGKEGGGALFIIQNKNTRLSPSVHWGIAAF